MRLCSHDHTSFTFLVSIAVQPLRKRCQYLEFFWSIFSPNAGKYAPEKLRIRTLFTQGPGKSKKDGPEIG